MKLRKMIGAVICASALAMATTVPAFAQLPYANDIKPFTQSDTQGKEGKGDTEVLGYATNFQIVATIPFVACVYMPLTGGDFIAVPDYDVYCIENKGKMPITVTGIDGTAIDSTKFGLVAGKQTAANGTNEVYMTVQAKQIGGLNPGAPMTRAINVLNSSGDKFVPGDSFGVGTGDQNKTGLLIDGGVNVGNAGALTEGVTYKLVNVKYTVAVA